MDDHRRIGGGGIYSFMRYENVTFKRWIGPTRNTEENGKNREHQMKNCLSHNSVSKWTWTWPFWLMSNDDVNWVEDRLNNGQFNNG